MATMAELSIPQIKRLLRACDVPPTSVLAATTKLELVELAGNHGIVQVPDEWTMEMIKQKNDRIKQENDLRRAIQMNTLGIEGPRETGSLSPLFGRPDLSPVSTQRSAGKPKVKKAKTQRPPPASIRYSPPSARNAYS